MQTVSDGHAVALRLNGSGNRPNWSVRLGQHGTVYRHYHSKAALREAVTRPWIETTHVGLTDAVEGTDPTASERLHHWLRLMRHI